MEKTTSNLHDAADRFGEARDRMSGKVNDAAEMANELYGKASEWLGEGYGKGIGLITLVAAAGVFGYVLGRKSAESDFGDSRTRPAMPRSLDT